VFDEGRRGGLGEDIGVRIGGCKEDNVEK
jgi:hypothetical protein